MIIVAPGIAVAVAADSGENFLDEWKIYIFSCVDFLANIAA